MRGEGRAGGRGEGRGGEEKGGEGKDGREGGRVGPQAKAWSPRTIFLAPALSLFVNITVNKWKYSAM